MRAHGTFACYQWGPEPGLRTGRGCRCFPCSDARYRYDLARRRARENGVEPFVDATPAVEHLEWLAERGIGTRTIAAASNVSRSTLRELRNGTRTRVRPDTLDRLLAVGTHRAKLVDAGPTWALLDELHAHGFTWTRIADELGYRSRTVQLKRTRVRASNARRVAEVHARLMAPVIAQRQWDAERQREHRRRKAVA